MCRIEVAQKMMRGAQMLEVSYKDSYYKNRDQLIQGLEIIEEAEELATQSEEISRSESRSIERIKYYVEKRIHGKEDVKEIQNVVQIVTNGLAWKIENPESFEGYSSDIQTHADRMVLQVKKKKDREL
jgi:hypothetical protein